MVVTVMVNGSALQLDEGATVARLLNRLQVVPERVAVELNLEIIDRAAFSERPLREGDRVEIISFVGGGAP